MEHTGHQTFWSVILFSRCIANDKLMILHLISRPDQLPDTSFPRSFYPRVHCIVRYRSHYSREFELKVLLRHVTVEIIYKTLIRTLPSISTDSHKQDISELDLYFLGKFEARLNNVETLSFCFFALFFFLNSVKRRFSSSVNRLKL